MCALRLRRELLHERTASRRALLRVSIPAAGLAQAFLSGDRRMRIRRQEIFHKNLVGTYDTDVSDASGNDCTDIFVARLQGPLWDDPIFIDGFDD